ncbi:MAG: hypothetical protein M3380_08585 [Chloroflexota bacterium]|nr:hypothetical protein [Chloroflexota bacterium]
MRTSFLYGSEGWAGIDAHLRYGGAIRQRDHFRVAGQKAMLLQPADRALAGRRRAAHRAAHSSPLRRIDPAGEGISTGISSTSA